MSEKTAVKIPEAVVEGIRSAGNVILLTHVHPDGDALGSSLGLAEILKDLGKKVCIFMEEPVSHLYRFLPGSDTIVTSIESVIRFAKQAAGDIVTVALDSGDNQRIGAEGMKLLDMIPFIVIDHHKSHEEFGEHSWVDPDMSSTGEMIFELARELQAEISFSAAVNLYVAICTDTGSFRYECTRPRTLQIAAELVAMGVQPEKVSKCLFDNVSLPRMKLLQMVLGTLQVFEGEQLAFVHVTRDMIDQSGATKHDIEGFVDYPRSLSQVKVAVFIKDLGDGAISVSLRAKGDCDVADVAEVFSGGGHRNAAGFRFSDKSLSDVYDIVLRELRSRLKKNVQ